MKPGATSCHIGVDLLGSDVPPKALLEAAVSFSESLPPTTHLVLLGPPEIFASLTPPRLNLVFQPVQEEIRMEDSPLTAIRQKKESSLCTGIRWLREGRLQAFISAGNTGALIACATIELPALPSLEKSALMTLLPTKGGDMAVLDVGATTTCNALHLTQFAMMGVAYQKSRGIPLPRVGLLNIGTEAKKGTPEHQKAYQQLHQLSQRSSAFQFIGNVEGRDAFSGSVDVLVTDGFTGNVFLKTSEGVATLILDEVMNATPPEEQHRFSRLRYTEHPGAVLAGIDGIVIKCHGTTSPQSLTRSIASATRLIEHQFLSQIKKELALICPPHFL